MKEIKDLDLPEDLKYAEDHEWVVPFEKTMRVGITDYAQDQLGDIVFVELPKVGDVFEKGEEFGTVESVKTVAELLMPIDGEILKVNSVLEDSPELVNDDPYVDGWMLEVRATDSKDFDALMTRKEYLQHLKGLE